VGENRDRRISAHHADRIVAERNNGGAMVEATIRMVDNNLPVTTVWASHRKVVRAEPVSALYEQGRVHHIGTFPQLEDEMCAANVRSKVRRVNIIGTPPNGKLNRRRLSLRNSGAGGVVILAAAGMSMKPKLQFTAAGGSW
jgi:Terminase RNaseH-like domain